MKNVVLALALSASVAGCTTAEQDVAVGAGIGATAGALIGRDVESALIGGAAGALAGYVITRNRGGDCVYRDRRTGERYVTRCPQGY